MSASAGSVLFLVQIIASAHTRQTHRRDWKTTATSRRKIFADIPENVPPTQSQSTMGGCQGQETRAALLDTPTESMLSVSELRNSFVRTKRDVLNKLLTEVLIQTVPLTTPSWLTDFVPEGFQALVLELVGVAR
ncbi:hypothetical protein EDD18DRAFT_1334373 [Armillaria luteobubalina]|uniref:Secreted protein n=1 Tax=Armillaria luteobubalina TaxID=153913 RepID=A0AA39PYH2_9AGAR|nr:hypothetical protein EDD18DRAFT_1334373 [Armillaria luteobubalina]